MLPSPSHSTKQSKERLEDVYLVPEEQETGVRRQKNLYGVRGLHPPGFSHSPHFYGAIAFASTFAIIFVASHCFTYIRHGQTAWWRQQRRLADSQQRGGNGKGKDDSLTCGWLKDISEEPDTLESSARSTVTAGPSGMYSRPAGHGYKRIWETASDEELKNMSELQKRTEISAGSQGANMEGILSRTEEYLIEEALAEGVALQVDPWLVDPRLEPPAGLLFEGVQGGRTLSLQGIPEAGTSHIADSTVLATAAPVPPPAFPGAPNADIVQQLSQMAASSPLEQSQQLFSEWGTQALDGMDLWNERPSFPVSLHDQAELALTSGVTQYANNGVHGQRESSLQIYHPYAGKAMPSFCFPACESVSPESASALDQRVRWHPFYRTPQLPPGVVPRKFNMKIARAASRTTFSPLRALIQSSSWLKMSMLDLSGANMLMSALEELVGFAMTNVKRTLTVIRPVFAVETLALYLLLADSLYASSMTLGESAQRHIWWNRIMMQLPSDCVISGHPNPRRVTKDLLSLAGRIKSALEIFRSGMRPPPTILVPLKQEIFCSGLLRKFQRGNWKFFKGQDDEWKADTEIHP